MKNKKSHDKNIVSKQKARPNYRKKKNLEKCYNLYHVYLDTDLVIFTTECKTRMTGVRYEQHKCNRILLSSWIKSASLHARKRKLKLSQSQKISKFFCSFTCKSWESKSTNNHEYQRSINTAYSASQRDKRLSKSSHQLYGPKTKPQWRSFWYYL